MSRTYIYRVIKSSWGIRIVLTAEVRRTADTPGAVHVGADVWIAQDSIERQLGKNEMEMLTRGARRLATEVREANGTAPIVIVIKDVSYNDSDYQIEGLAAAMFDWIIAEFDLLRKPSVATYVKEANQYHFDPDFSSS